MVQLGNIIQFLNLDISDAILLEDVFKEGLVLQLQTPAIAMDVTNRFRF